MDAVSAERVARVRAFNRSYTRAIGVLTDAFNHMLNQIARTLLRMGQLLPQSHAASRPFNHHDASSSIVDAWRVASIPGPAKPAGLVPQ